MWATVVPKSFTSLSWRLELPAPAGMVMQPRRSAPKWMPRPPVNRPKVEHTNTFLAFARHVKAAGHEIGPAVDVGLGIADGYRGASGAAGAVHTHEFGMRNRGEPIRILGAEIVLAGKGNPPDVLKGA